MNVLTFNCGSSSLKYRLIQMPSETELAGGEAQRVGPKTTERARIIHTVKGQTKETVYVDMPDHGAAFAEVLKLLRRDKELLPEVFGHRLVHGGSRFTDVAVLSAKQIEALPELGKLAPLHNPPAIALVQACHQIAPQLPQVVICDTAFHATLPAHASTYALPASIRAGLGIRKYGFHGISHQYVTQEAARFMRKPLKSFNAVSCHLGSGGASLCAVVAGQSVDNTMGYSPLQGLVMSTRCGDLDPAITMALLAQTQGNASLVEGMLNKKSGVLGLSGLSADIRDVLRTISDKHPPTRLDTTWQVYLWRLRKYLGAYLTVVGTADAVIFTDTIGELVPQVRWGVCANMNAFGLKIDADRNRSVTAWPVDVAAADSLVRVLVIQTNEELSIARSTYHAIQTAA